jgi:hypothetical protein
MLALGIVAVLAVSSCSPSAPPSRSGTSFSGSGSRVTDWIHVAAGEYVVEGSMGRPAGCVQSMNLVGTNEYAVVSVIRPGGALIGRRPNDPSPAPPKPDQLVGYRTSLVFGQYRFEIGAPKGCYWTATVHPPVPGTVPELPVRGRCSQLGNAGYGHFVKITGQRVALPADNPLAGDPQIVQPDGYTIEHYAVGIDDGSAICTVLWTENQPQLGATVTFTAEVLQENGRFYLGVVLA